MNYISIHCFSMIFIFLLSACAQDPCGENYFCSDGYLPIGTDKIRTRVLTTMHEEPLRNHGDASLTLRCSVFPAFGDEVSIAVQVPKKRSAKSVITAKRLKRRVEPASALEVNSRVLKADELQEILASFQASGFWEIRSKLDIYDMFMKDGETWILEAKEQAKYQAIERVTIDPPLRQLCELMVRYSPLVGSVANGDADNPRRAIIIEK